MKPFKQVNLEDILTAKEIQRTRELYKEKSEESFNDRIVGEIIGPNIDRINRATNQVNNPRFIGYAIEWCLLQEAKGKGVKKGKAA